VDLKAIVDNLHRLGEDELVTLIRACQFLLNQRQADAGVAMSEPGGDGGLPPMSGSAASLSRNGHGGWIELKMIPRQTKRGRKLYGPYKYRRRWVNKGGRRVLTSEYMGKV